MAEMIPDTRPPRQLRKFVQRGAHFISGLSLSIRAKLLLAFFVVILITSSVNVLLIVRAQEYKYQFDALINNITTANSINGYIKPAIDTELWDIVKGQTSFDEGKQYQILEDVNNKINQMSASTDSETGRQMLEVIRRTMGTLRYYVDQLGAQMKNGSKYDENVQALDNIRGISTLIEESVQEYMLFEVNRTGQKYAETQASFAQWLITSALLIALAILFAVLTAWVIAESIYVPIKKLREVTTTITQEDLEVLATGSHTDEITELGLSFNILVGKVRQLLDEKIKEQELLQKAEMRALQAQINPHFLYNTLDTIIWLAETKDTGQVVNVVRALSNFFRVTLSKGRDWILVREELEHVRGYLTIQKVRYRDILDYQIEVDESVLESTILKLTLQPLVENALYHGIKNKRDGGVIMLRGFRENEHTVRFEVEDNGIGIPLARLQQIHTALQNGSYDDEIGENGYGIYNVDKRIKLFYGDAYGVSLDSEFQKGTRVIVRLPFQLGKGSGGK